jgi:hypothetical protein
MGPTRTLDPRITHRTRLQTAFLKVARQDWAALVCGEKREYRVVRGRNQSPNAAGRWRTPAPVVAFSYQAFRDEPDFALLICEDTWTEPLGAISAQSLAAEGFDSIDEFRLYWRDREPKGFRPLTDVAVYRLRPWEDSDRAEQAEILLERVYGAFL